MLKGKHAILMRLLVLMAFVSPFSISCSMFVTPAHSVEVQNNSDKPVVIVGRVFIDGVWGETRNWGQVEAKARRAVFSMVEPASKSDDERYRVEARDLDGELIKSWEFPFQERVLLVIDKADVP